MKTANNLLKKALMAFSIGLTITSGMQAMQVPVPKDPYQSIRYEKAFNQTKIYAKHKQLLEKLGCIKNILSQKELGFVSDTQSETKRTASDDVVLEIRDEEYSPLVTKDDQEKIAEELQAFEADCLNNLNKARRMALAEPGIYAVTEMGLMGGGAALAMGTLGSNSMGGSFAGFAAIFDSLRLLKGTIQSGHYLCSWPDNQLKDLEEQFAKNKCYIPQVLWSKINKAFVAARQNEFSRETHTKFIEFSLGFTTFKPKPHIACKDGMSIDQVKQELRDKIFKFFYNKYAIAKEHEHELYQIVLNVNKFLDSLVCDHAPTVVLELPSYIYLFGSGGIGKTHFVQTLANWIEELIPGSVRFEDVVINGVDELEGTPAKPGAFLNVLRNQLVSNKRGSIVIIDEATWLNDRGMVSSSKRVFNGDRSKLSTSYFGEGMDGSSVKLEMPPMLIFVASNEKITDTALASRFDTIDYPKPTTEALINDALEFAGKSTALKQAGITQTQEIKDMIIAWIESLNDGDERHFRYIRKNIEPFLLHAQSKKRQCPATELVELKKEAEKHDAGL